VALKGGSEVPFLREISDFFDSEKEFKVWRGDWLSNPDPEVRTRISELLRK